MISHRPRSAPFVLALILAACADITHPNPPAAPSALPLLSAASGAVPVKDLGTLGGSWGVAHNVNTSGQVVGYAATASGAHHAFVWSESSGMRDLGTLGGAHSAGIAINDLGQAVGMSVTSHGVTRAFLWTETYGMRDLGVLPGGRWSIARGITSLGTVVGYGDNAAGETRVFVWTPGGGMRDRGTGAATGINASGWLVGQNSTGPALWFPDGNVQSLGTLGGTGGIAWAINKHGQVVGQSNTASREARGFRWTADQGMADLGTLGGNESNALDVDDQGVIIGNSKTVSGEQRAALWTATGVVDLGTLGGSYSFGMGISDDGRYAVGYAATASAQSHPVLWTLAVSPQAQIDRIHKSVTALTDEGVLNAGQGTALLSKLEAALLGLEQANVRAAVGQLQAFVNQCEALVRRRVLNSAQAQPLIEAARRVIAQLQD